MAISREFEADSFSSSAARLRRPIAISRWPALAQDRDPRRSSCEASGKTLEELLAVLCGLVLATVVDEEVDDVDDEAEAASVVGRLLLLHGA